MQTLQFQLAGLTVAYFVLEALGFALGMWALYYAVKCAIRDGIKESGLVNDWRSAVRTARQERPATSLPDMRAER